MITSNKVIENLQARLLSLVLDIRKIARGYIERVAYRFAALSVFFSRGFIYTIIDRKIIILLTVFLEKNKSDYQNAISVAKNRLKQLQE